MDIDWTDPKSQVTEHFNVSDMCMLHQWGRLATVEDGCDFDKLIQLAFMLEKVRALLGVPMRVHCAFRSAEYNLRIGAPAHDVHSLCEACDFDCSPHLTTDEVKAKLLPELEAMGIRLEDNGPGASWCHIDVHPVIHARFFKP